MNNKVWDILSKDKYTEEGQKEIEKLYNAIERIYSTSNNKDFQILSEGINSTLYEVMDILDNIIEK